MSVEREAEVFVVGADVDAFDVGAVGEAGEKLTANFGKERVSDEGIHHAGSALEFGAAFRNEFGDGIVESERDFVVGLDTFFDAREIQPDDLAEHFLADGVKGNHDEAVQKSVREDFNQRTAKSFFEAFG
jgi:hypothetical protein